MFADLNKYAIRPSPSLASLYDHRDASSNLARYLAMSVEPFVGMTELEKSNISQRSNKLFTLSSIKQATRALLGKDPKKSDFEECTQIATRYWQAIYNVMPDWQLAAKRKFHRFNYVRTMFTLTVLVCRHSDN